ncbi:cellobiose phosphorylase [Mycobacterium tuberculosis]|nr:cellobiose phosphorylase [Mycobacterium tuberculosis]CKT50648.1 cellobiose phosphorylase [Mycobacterium tuberculosis]CKV89697.1 cellobiose phosphorylase [Mycobacterium tuberculosis]
MTLLVTEPLRHRQRRQRNTHTGARRLVHLSEYQRGVLEHVGFGKLDPQIVALAGALAHSGEHRRTTEVTGDAVDHLLNQHRLAHPGTAEQCDLAATNIRSQQVDHLQTGLEHLGPRLQLLERRRLAVNRPVFEFFAISRLVQAISQRIEDVALHTLTDRHRDRPPGVDHLDAAHQAVGRLQRDGAHQVVAEVLRHLQGEGFRQRLEGDLSVQCIEQLGDGTARKLDVDDGPSDPYHAAAGVGASRLSRPVGLFGSGSHIFFASSWG